MAAGCHVSRPVRPGTEDAEKPIAQHHKNPRRLDFEISLMSVRVDINQRLKTALASRFGNHCPNPRCRQPTSGPKTDPSGFLNVEVAARITADSPGGPRYEESM